MNRDWLEIKLISVIKRCQGLYSNEEIANHVIKLADEIEGLYNRNDKLSPSISYDSLSESFKKTIDSIEDNLTQ